MYAEECLLDQSDRLGLSLIIFDSFEIPWSMEPPLSLFFFFSSEPWKLFSSYFLLPFPLLSVTCSLGKIQSLAF